MRAHEKHSDLSLLVACLLSPSRHEYTAKDSGIHVTNIHGLSQENPRVTSDKAHGLSEDLRRQDKHREGIVCQKGPVAYTAPERKHLPYLVIDYH
ncbi:hypothetical protein PgNI_10516, partial [Pyricularia grisea]|uniref:Uncharacterized protein n=1 Tax=Pyricularia grisea TaxID=148305 RepID=A0A6P8AX69_PYRGI